MAGDHARQNDNAMQGVPMSTPLPPVPTGRQRRMEAQFLVTTPMFIGDATQQAASIRPPSLKGALRFWWRALQWPRLYREERATAPALKRLHHEEAELFGLAAKKDTQGHEVGGQARVTLRVEDSDAQAYIARPKVSPAVQYLLGLGLFHFRDGVLRDAVMPGSRFTLALVGRPGRNGPSDAQWQSLEEALLVFGLLGGQGSRARKGLGSVSLQALSGGSISVPQTKEAYQQALQDLLATLPLEGAALPPFTAFSGSSRLDISLIGDNAMTVLNELGNQQQLYRAYGYKGEVNYQPAEKKFFRDHDDMLDFIKGQKVQIPPRRTVFGLPHNYRFSDGGEVKINTNEEKKFGRRASPLFLHVHQLPDGVCLGVQLILPAVFLHASENSLTFKAGRSREQKLRLASGDIDWTVLHGLLDRFEQRTTLLSPQTQQPREAQA